MHIDNYTLIFNKEDTCSFLYNLRTGAQDILKGKAVIQFKKLLEKESFDPICLEFSNELISYLIKRGHICVSSFSETHKDALWMVESARKEILLSEPELGFVIHPKAAQAFCPFYDVLSFESLEKKEFNLDIWKKIFYFSVLQYKMSNRIGIYLSVNDFLGCFSQLKFFIKYILNHNIKNVVIYLVATTEEELSLAVSRINEILAVVDVLVLNEKTRIIKRRTFYERKEILLFYPFICPFIYRSIFITEKGQFDFCPVLAFGKECMGILFPDYNIKVDWEKELFLSLCEKSDNSCIWSHLCSKRCPALKSVIQDNGLLDKKISSCAVVDKLDEILRCSVARVGEGKEEQIRDLLLF